MSNEGRPLEKRPSYDLDTELQGSNNITEESADKHELPFASFAHELAFVLTMMSAQLFTQAGVAQANTPLQIIGDYFNVTDTATRSWYVASYSLTVGTFILIAGRLGDMYGHKKMFLIGWSWFSLWSLVGGLASYVRSSGIFFNVCRGLQGIGPALLIPNALALIGRTYPEGQRKHLAFALFGACAPGGYVVGSIFSALLAERTSWPWVYYIMAIACAVMIPVSYFAIAKDEHAPGHEEEKFDFFGAFFGVAGLILFNVAWNQAPIVGWKNAQCIVLLILGTICIGVFVYIEKKVAEHPLIPFFSGTIALVLGCVACGWAVFGIWIFNLWQLIETLRGVSPILISAQMAPCAIAGFVYAVLTGFLVSRVPISLIMTIALLIFTATSIIGATMPVEQTYWAQTFVTFIIAPMGMEFSFPSATILLSSAVPRKHQGIAASLVTTVVNYSISIGLGISGTVQAYLFPDNNPEDSLKIIRSGLYTGIGIGGLGICLALISLYKEVVIDKKRQKISR